MDYKYSGYLETLLGAPDPKVRDTLDHIAFTAADMANWKFSDEACEKEWAKVSVRTEVTETGLLLEGDFSDARRIDDLDDDPRYWVPLSSKTWQDDRFPVDVARYPIIEVTYRCLTECAHPGWVCHYEGGARVESLEPSRTWRTVVCRVPHFGFPSSVKGLTLRLYGTRRGKESMEVQSIRFRAMSPEEAKVCRKQDKALTEMKPPPHYPLLDKFMPFGVFMRAGIAKRLSETMEISLEDYWGLALEDIVRHHHNCIALEEADLLSSAEWHMLLEAAESYGVRILAIHEWPLDDLEARGAALVKERIAPYANSGALLGWSVTASPDERTFPAHLRARELIEQADPNHPLVTMTKRQDSYPLYAPFFAAAGVEHFRTHRPWDLAAVVKNHLPLNGGQHLWVTVPGFIYATSVPEWSTCPEIRLMMNLALANGARGLFSHAYHNDPIWVTGNYQRSLTGPFLTFSDLWSEIGNRICSLTAMAPLLLSAAPTEAPAVELNITWEVHQRSVRPADVPPLHWTYLQGSDFTLVYVVSNDTSEVTTVHIAVPELLPDGVEVFDIMDFVRSRVWTPVERERHLEMFPGQGQLVLIAEAGVCSAWRDVIVRRMIEEDTRLLGLDMALAKRFALDVSAAEELVRKPDSASLLEDMRRTRAARDRLVDIIYDSPTLVAARSKLISASAGICGCDGTLCRLLKKGKTDRARKLGKKVLPLTRELSRLRLELRKGRGLEIIEECEALSNAIIALLTEIRANI